jgi:hypothetical protein
MSGKKRHCPSRRFSWRSNRNLEGFTMAAVLLALWCGPAISTGQPNGQSTLYRLNTNSTLMQGCFAPCECPLVFFGPVKGTFLLTLTNSNSLFNTYAVTEVSWSVPMGSVISAVTGAGAYRIGGEFALQQQLSLDLQMDGGNVEHYDSGLVTGSTPFPELTVAISTNGQYCVDSVFSLSAAPGPAPQLHVRLAGAQVIVSWTVSPNALVLEESSELSTDTWTIVTNVPIVVGQQNQVVLARSSGSKFYRLH